MLHLYLLRLCANFPLVQVEERPSPVHDFSHNSKTEPLVGMKIILSLSCLIFERISRRSTLLFLIFFSLTMFLKNASFFSIFFFSLLSVATLFFPLR